MDVVGFRPDEKSSIYSLLSAILNLGNVTFDEGDDHSAGHDFVSLSNGKCKLKSSNHLLYRFTPQKQPARIHDSGTTCGVISFNSQMSLMYL